MANKSYIALLLMFMPLVSTELPDLFSRQRIVFDTNKTQQLFEYFKQTFNNSYNTADENNKRLNIFRVNLEEINKLNSANGTDVYGVTKHSDLTYEEYLKVSGAENYDTLENDTQTIEIKMSERSVPDNWDWRKQGFVSAVGDQKQCKSCWAFSATGLIEGQQALKAKKLIPLSVQMLIDCVNPGKGCGDGLMYPHLAIQKIQKEYGGFMADDGYRSLGFQSACRFNENMTVVRVKDVKRYNVTGEEHLRGLVYNYGPVAVGFLIGSGFQKYKSGIASAQNLKCNGFPRLLNHSVLIVGFGVENGVQYWIIKNSHGENWGERGYLRLRAGQNPCNILEYIAVVQLARVNNMKLKG